LIQANNPDTENLVTRRLVARESKADINWDAALGFNLFGGNEANDCANPARSEVEKSDNPSTNELQRTIVIIVAAVKKTNTHFKVMKMKMRKL
jgi:hypothetical protein